MNNSVEHLNLYIDWNKRLIASYTKSLNRKKSTINRKYWITAIKLCQEYIENLENRLKNQNFVYELKADQNGYLESIPVSSTSVTG